MWVLWRRRCQSDQRRKEEQEGGGGRRSTQIILPPDHQSVELVKKNEAIKTGSREGNLMHVLKTSPGPPTPALRHSNSDTQQQESTCLTPSPYRSGAQAVDSSQATNNRLAKKLEDRHHADLDNEKRTHRPKHLSTIDHLKSITHFTRAAQNPRLIQGV